MFDVRGSIRCIRGNPSDADEPIAWHDDESRADNRQHDGDDELERVVGSDLLWDRSS
jgi:hypothetical protein